ncbi:hypothetical protein ScPMuIL_010546 [Solemya velum]
MTMMDDKDFLIKHIRNAFITSDDTGMCEMIIEPDDVEKSRTSPSDGTVPSSLSDTGIDSSDTDMPHSYDIQPEMDYGAHRRRSNTAQRLERMKKEKRNQTKIKHIPWRTVPETTDDKGRYFEKKHIANVDREPKSNMVSLLSHQLDEADIMGENPFKEYVRFDGKATIGLPTKKIDIFLTMAEPEDRPYPLTIVCLASAKIQDLIGLICWQYTQEDREPLLNENREMYCLRIAEDDGEVDIDFPSLDNREPLSKFGFNKLALVEREAPPSSPKTSPVVTVNIPNRGFNKFQINSPSILMKEILQKVIKRRKVKQRQGLKYNLEKQEEPGIAVDLEAPLGFMNTLEFCLVRENSTRGEMEIEESFTSDMARSLTSHQYKSYIVYMVHKWRANIEVHLGISGEKVEIDPISSKSSSKLFRQRAVTYDADSIAACDMLEEKSTGRCLFRLTYSSDYKHHDFEADLETATEVVEKINNILELRLSPIRKEHVAHRDRRSHRKRDSLKLS